MRLRERNMIINLLSGVKRSDGVEANSIGSYTLQDSRNRGTGDGPPVRGLKSLWRLVGTVPSRSPWKRDHRHKSREIVMSKSVCGLYPPTQQRVEYKNVVCKNIRPHDVRRAFEDVSRLKKIAPYRRVTCRNVNSSKAGGH